MATRMIPGEAHPYMATSAPGVVDEMLAEIGLDDVDELFEQIPESHRLSRPIELPPAIEGFRTRRINFTFRYVPDEHITPFAQLPAAAREDVRDYVATLAQSSAFWKRAL